MRLMLSLFVSLVLPVSLFAEEKTKEPKPIPEPTQFVTEHSGRFNNQTVRYQVIAGETYIRDKDDKPKASIFTFAYLKDDVTDLGQRPVTFVWNGGPGSASVWLHIGTMGPKRVVVPSDAGHAGAAPFDIVDNSETILDVTDLVFVDPVGTGFSKALGSHENKEFWGLTEDATAIAQFIRTWITENGRWNSPKYLLGESYGTTRAGLVADYLQGTQDDLSLNGIIFVSQALDYTGSTPVADNLVAFVTYLPTMAATAYYHNRVNPKPDDFETFIQDARDFAVQEYLPALFLGSTLQGDKRQAVIQRYAYFTGLSEAYVARSDLRVTAGRFNKELLRDQGVSVGRLDSRYTQDEIDDVDDSIGRDAARDGISGAYKAALMEYMFRDLNVDWQRTYQSPSDDALGNHWNYRTGPSNRYWEPSYVNTGPNFSQALRRNPSLRVLVANGYYDMVTPFFDAEYTLARHGFKPEQLVFTYYHGGHMMYVHDPSRVQLLQDMRNFVLGQ